VASLLLVLLGEMLPAFALAGLILGRNMPWLNMKFSTCAAVCMVVAGICMHGLVTHCVNNLSLDKINDFDDCAAQYMGYVPLLPLVYGHDVVVEKATRHAVCRMTD